MGRWLLRSSRLIIERRLFVTRKRRGDSTFVCKSNPTAFLSAVRRNFKHTLYTPQISQAVVCSKHSATSAPGNYEAENRHGYKSLADKYAATRILRT